MVLESKNYNEERSEERIRAIKLKTECLRLTLKNLQDMLHAEKIKLKQEKGEVEGMAREKGLILLEPAMIHNLPSIAYTPTIRPQTCKIHSSIQSGQSNKFFDSSPVADGKKSSEWGQGDGMKKQKDDSNLSSGVLHRYDYYRHAAWEDDRQQKTAQETLSEGQDESDSTSSLNNNFDWSYVYNNNDLWTSSQQDEMKDQCYNGQKNTSSDHLLTHDSTTAQCDDYTSNYGGTVDDSVSLSSDKHIAALISEVNNITQAIEDLQNQS